MKSRLIRKEKRIAADYLPSKYKALNVITSSKKKIKAITVDISLNGVGFYTDDSGDLNIGSSFEFLSEEAQKPVLGKVVYIKPDVNGTRIGAILENKDGYSEYKKDLTKILNDIETKKSKF